MLLQPVALTEDLPEQHLQCDRVGTVVEVLAEGTFLVEFSDDRGRTEALLPLDDRQLRPLHHQQTVIS